MGRNSRKYRTAIRGKNTNSVNLGTVLSYFHSYMSLGNPRPTDNCTDFSETGYKCVPYYNCENGTIITDGGGIIGIRTEEDRVVLDPANSICPGLLEVCCRNEDFFAEPVFKNKVGLKEEVRLKIPNNETISYI